MSEKSNKQKEPLTRTELELTQKIQMHFPSGGIIPPEIIQAWNGLTKEVLADELLKTFGKSPKVISELLEFICDISVPASTKKFIPRKNFIVDTSRKAKVKIYWLNERFSNEFLDKTEMPSDPTILCCQKLRKSSVDIPIIDELGGEEKAETTLVEMFALMEKQGNGESGKLLTNGYANIFYIRNLAGVLRVVYCRCDDVGWGVGAYGFGGPRGWGDGYQVFSRSSLKS